MKLEQLLLDSNSDSTIVSVSEGFDIKRATLVLAFGEREFLEDLMPYNFLKARYNNAEIVICSTSGQISDTSLIENKLVVTAIEFEKTKLKLFEFNISKERNLASFNSRIKHSLVNPELNSILVLSEGSFVNGTELVQELESITDSKIPIYGGLAGDSVNFKKTMVGVNSNAKEGTIALIGFYGDALTLNFGCEGGWSDYGPEREVNQSENNVVYQIGNRLALDLYKEYLGSYADELPGSALYFPLSMKENSNASPVVRTILSIDETTKSMTFAGNIPQGAMVRLMKGNFDKLINAAYDAATESSNKNNAPQLAFIVSCVGRKIVLDNRIEEELEAMKETFGPTTMLCGFYSYGEISPIVEHKACELHNQTITVVTFNEK
jgi:hypothetical protein